MLNNAANDFENWKNQYFNIKSKHRQLPVQLHLNGQFYEATIDIFLETTDGYQVICTTRLSVSRKGDSKRQRNRQAV